MPFISNSKIRSILWIGSIRQRVLLLIFDVALGLAFFLKDLSFLRHQRTRTNHCTDLFSFPFAFYSGLNNLRRACSSNRNRYWFIPLVDKQTHIDRSHIVSMDRRYDLLSHVSLRSTVPFKVYSPRLSWCLFSFRLIRWERELFCCCFLFYFVRRQYDAQAT